MRGRAFSCLPLIRSLSKIPGTVTVLNRAGKQPHPAYYTLK